MSQSIHEQVRRQLRSSPTLGKASRGAARSALLRASAITLALVLLTGLAAGQVRDGREREVERETRLIADQAAGHLGSWIDGRVATVHAFVQRWPDRYSGRPEIFRRDARVFLERLPGLQALNWVDTDWVIRTTVPNEGNEAALGRDLHHHPFAEVPRALAQADASGLPARTAAAVVFFQGGQGFATYWPVMGRDGTEEGFVNAVFRTDRMMEVSRVASQLQAEYRIGLVEDDGSVAFASPGEDADETAAWPFAERRKLPLIDRPIALVTAPTPARLSALATPADLRNLLGVLGACALVGVLAYGVLRRQTDLNRLALATAQAEEGILVVGRDARIEYANAAATRMMARDGLGGRDVFSLSEGEGDDALLTEIAEAVAQGRVWQRRYASVWSDGSRHLRDASVTPVREPSGSVSRFVAVIRDVTREHELQEQLRHSQKMEAVGRLAGGAAHEFNNLLTVIQGYAEQLVDELDEKAESRRAAATIQDAARRAARIVGQLLAFARRTDSQPERLHLAAAVDRLEMVLRGAVGEQVTLVMHHAPDLPPVLVDPGHIQQVLVNLCMNARDALPGGGTVTLETREEEIGEEPSGTLPELPAGRYAALSVADDGLGMDEAVRARMFEPFFTTKEVGRGTGLGLATVYGIAEQAGGALRVESEPGRGTVVTLYLPVAE